MFQIVFNEISAAEISSLDTLEQLELLEEFKVHKEDLENLDEERFGKIERDGTVLYRYRANEYRFYFEVKDDLVVVHRVLHKGTFSDFLFRSKAKKRNLYVIVNDSISLKDAYSAVDGSLASIARKTIATLTKQLMIQTVYRGSVRATHSNTGFYLISIPDHLGLNAQSLSFNKSFIGRLYREGKAHGEREKPWTRRPLGLRNFDIAVTPRKRRS